MQTINLDLNVYDDNLTEFKHSGVENIFNCSEGNFISNSPFIRK